MVLGICVIGVYQSSTVINTLGAFASLDNVVLYWLLAALWCVCQTMDAVRRRLAPIRGIPTKAGKMADPNQDIKEVFDFIDELPKAPAKVFDNIRRWVSAPQ